MLKLVNLKKDYKVPSGKVEALKGINLTFRKNEFVAILGPSGCGKTTLLNLVGGLDRYTDGNMYINGVSTKNFTDRNFDVYRNHRIGFVFQSYNLIPHQSVLSNVELALTIAGISKEERQKRAKEALDKVGLADQYYKKPNQLSGGQCQRVAIARALVNDPEILLADEPTGALDTKTSVQIMNLIKEIAKDRLVIMVTHNPELATEYANRIINLLDGKVIDDSNPYNPENEVFEKEDKEKIKAQEKAKMSWWTAFKLSLQNLISKRSRTILTSIASSIGIIGISLVLALSYGLQKYIDNVQNDMLSGNPITVTETGLDLSSMFGDSGMGEKIDFIKENGYVNINKMIEQIAKRATQSQNFTVSNNITQEYINYVTSMPNDYQTAIYLDYGLDVSNNIYTDYRVDGNSDTDIVSLSTIKTIFTAILKQNENTKNYANLITGFIQDFKQVPNNEEYILSQYNILDGKFATGKNEIMLVVNKDSIVNDLLLAQLGYYTQEEFVNLVLKAIEDDRYNPELDNKEKISYSELMNKTFTWYPNDTIFNDQQANPLVPFTYNAYTKDFKVSNPEGVNLEIVGILEPKDNISFGSLQSGFYYTEELTEYMINTNLNSEIVEYALTKDDETIYSGKSPQAGDIPFGVTFTYSFKYFDEEFDDQIGFVGGIDIGSSLIGSIIGSAGESYEAYSLTARNLGGKTLANSISIYNKDLDEKELALEYLDKWNSDEVLVVNGVELAKEDRDEVIYTDTLTIIFNLINGVLTGVTIALIGFTSLSLFVSSVMIAVITYISVVERVKEIGVIRSLGGRKRDVSNLFIAETAIIGLAAGTIAILFTYFASFIVNIIVKKPLGAAIAIFPWHYAIIMIVISITLTLISGLTPSRAAAKKDPVEALRTE